MSPPAAKPMTVRRRVPGFSGATDATDPHDPLPPSTDEEPAATPADSTEAATAAPTGSGADRGDAATPAADATDRGDAATPAADATAAPAATGRAKPDRRSPERKTISTNGTAPEPRGGEAVKPGGHRHQSNFRLFDSEVSYLKQLRRKFEDDGIDTDVTELVHALVYAARRGELEPLEILRRWRKDLNEI